MRTVTTAEEKLNWIFTAFDTDGGGSIDVDEIKEIVLGCFRSRLIILINLSILIINIIINIIYIFSSCTSYYTSSSTFPGWLVSRRMTRCYPAAWRT